MRLHLGQTSVDAATALDAGSVDLCFIDASHQHPWPLIDTLCVLPLMREGGVIVHHDLRMMYSRTARRAIGPKVVLDQVPMRSRIMFRQVAHPNDSRGLKTRKYPGNIFAMRCPENIGPYAVRLSDGFYIPWTLSRLCPREQTDPVTELLRQRFPKPVSNAFLDGLSRFESETSLSQLALTLASHTTLGAVLRRFRQR